MYNKREVRERLRVYKIKSNLTTEQIGNYLEVSSSYASIILRAEVPFKIDVLCKLCKLFKCSPNDILGEKFNL